MTLTYVMLQDVMLRYVSLFLTLNHVSFLHKHNFVKDWSALWLRSQNWTVSSTLQEIYPDLLFVLV